MAMRIGYFALDDVNHFLAEHMALELGIELVPLSFRDGPPPNSCQALLYELDYLASADREELVGRLLKRKPAELVAVHGLNLRGSQMKALHDRGVAVFRRLDGELFRRLRRAVRERYRVTSSTESVSA
jgi:hypothetical protein